MDLRLHHFLPASLANGPGSRAVVWVQGCTLACPGCFNPETHPFRGGEKISPDRLFERILAAAEGIEGLTVSGGEPLQRPRPLLRLLQRVRQETALSVLVFTGYDWETVQRLPLGPALLATIDVLVAGPYQASARLAQGLVGSSNKTVHFLTGRYSAQDLQLVPTTELLITPTGEVILSGIDPLKW